MWPPDFPKEIWHYLLFENGFSNILWSTRRSLSWGRRSKHGIGWGAGRSKERGPRGSRSLGRFWGCFQKFFLPLGAVLTHKNPIVISSIEYLLFEMGFGTVWEIHLFCRQVLQRKEKPWRTARRRISASWDGFAYYEIGTSSTLGFLSKEIRHYLLFKNCFSDIFGSSPLDIYIYTIPFALHSLSWGSCFQHGNAGKSEGRCPFTGTVLGLLSKMLFQNDPWKNHCVPNLLTSSIWKGVWHCMGMNPLQTPALQASTSAKAKAAKPKKKEAEASTFWSCCATLYMYIYIYMYIHNYIYIYIDCPIARCTPDLNSWNIFYLKTVFPTIYFTMEYSFPFRPA